MNSHALVAQLLEDEPDDFAREIIQNYDPKLTTLQAYWDNGTPGSNSGNPWDRPFLRGRAMLNGKIAERVRRRDDGMFAVEYRMRDGRRLRVICHRDTPIKVVSNNEANYKPSHLIGDLSFVPKRDPYATLRTDDPGYVIEIPVEKFNWL